MIFRLFAIGLVVVMALSGPRPACASEALEAAIADLASGSFAEKTTAVSRLAASGDPRVVTVLEAFVGARLYTRKADGKVVIGRSRGRVVVLEDPLSGAHIGDVATSDVAPIRINNRLRGVTRAALGGLTLLSPDPTVRFGAASAVFKARNAEMEPLLATAIDQETDARVRKRMEDALAVIRLTHSKEKEARIEALGVLSRASDQDVRALVSGVLARNAQGEPLEPDAEVRAAAEAALVKIESRLALWRFGVNLFQGISLGSVLLLAAVGLAITFGVMGVINMAHGEMVMLGAYTTFVVQEQFRRYAPEAFDWSLAVAVPAAFLATAAVGIAIERGIIRHLYGRPLETLLATWGLSLILQQLVRTVFGPSNREVGNPSWMSGAIEAAGGFTFTYNRIWIIVFSFTVFALLILVMRKTTFGLRMRAVTQNRPMAAAMGIRTGWVDAYTFALGSGVAGLAGVALSQIDNVSPNLGQSYIIDSFLVVVLGGVGNLWGTLVGALSLGLVNKFLEPYTGAVLAKILVLVTIILFIQKRPRGLFALRGRSVEV